MNGSSSRPFFGLWIGFPAGALGLALFGAPGLDPLAAVSGASLFLAGFLLPAELERRQESPPRLLLTLALLQAPFFIAGGRLAAAGWRAAAEVLLLAVWMGIPSALWRRLRPPRFSLYYPFFFGLFGLGAPFLAYLVRDFGQRAPSWLAEASPFTAALRLAEGRDYGTGAIWSVGLFVGLVILSRWKKTESGRADSRP